LKNKTITESAGYCKKLNNPTSVLENLPGSVNKTMTICEANVDFYSMQYSLLINVFVVGLGALFFFLTAIWIVKDKLRAENPALRDDSHANPGETKEMLGVMESGGLEDSIDSDDIPPIMMMSNKSEINHSPNHKYDRASNLQISKVVDEYYGRHTQPESAFISEERKPLSSSGYHPLNTTSAISKFQRLLDTPDTSSERLDTAHVSTSSSAPPSPATPKSLRS